MIKTIDSNDSLKDKPRPHYLVGDAEYEEKNGIYQLTAKVLFTSEHPSIADRLNLEIPHVNIGDAYFGLWNSVHLIANEAGWKNLLAVTGTYKAKGTLIDEELNLETKLFNIKQIQGKLFANYIGTYCRNNKKLLILEGLGCGYLK